MYGPTGAWESLNWEDAYAQLVRDTLTYLGHSKRKAPAPPKLSPLPPAKIAKAAQPPPPPEPAAPFVTLEKPGLLVLEPMVKPLEEPFADVRRRIGERMGRLKVVDEIPDDAVARAKREQWRERQQIPEIAILFYEETIQSRTFLTNLAKAIALCIAPCDLFSVTQFERLLVEKGPKLILITDYALHGFPAVRRHLREGGPRPLLGEVPLFLLTELPRYFQDPKQKVALWTALSKSYG